MGRPDVPLGEHLGPSGSAFDSTFPRARPRQRYAFAMVAMALCCLRPDLVQLDDWTAADEAALQHNVYRMEPHIPTALDAWIFA
jgi:hypothetical protein